MGCIYFVARGIQARSRTRVRSLAFTLARLVSARYKCVKAYVARELMGCIYFVARGIQARSRTRVRSLAFTFARLVSAVYNDF